MDKISIKGKTEQNCFYYVTAETVMGWIGIAANEQGVIKLILPERCPEDVLAKLSSHFQSRGLLFRADEQFSSLVKRIQAYFEGKLIKFNKEKVNLSGYTLFQRRVLLKAREIPYGEVRSYRWLAEQSGYPRAYRAVGGVMRINPVPLIIPCHRLIGSKGQLTGFSARGGVEMKRRMLTLEGVSLKDNQEL